MIATNPVFAAQYRQSSFFKIFESKTSVAPDEEFVRKIKELIPENQRLINNLGVNTDDIAGDSGAIFNRIKDKIQTAARGRDVSDTEVAYRIAGKFISDKADETTQLATKALLGDLFNRQRFTAFGAQDGLGIYVNKLGFAASLEAQKNAGINEIQQLIAENAKAKGRLAPIAGLFDDIRNELDNLKLPSIAIYSPEKAIDAGISGSGGTLRAGFSAEELMTSVRSYLSQSRIRSNICETIGIECNSRFWNYFRRSCWRNGIDSYESVKF